MKPHAFSLVLNGIPMEVDGFSLSSNGKSMEFDGIYGSALNVHGISMISKGYAMVPNGIPKEIDGFSLISNGFPSASKVSMGATRACNPQPTGRWRVFAPSPPFPPKIGNV